MINPRYALCFLGFSDPFVLVKLLPPRLFPHTNEQKTQIRKRNLDPVFDEIFEL